MDRIFWRMSSWLLGEFSQAIVFPSPPALLPAVELSVLGDVHCGERGLRRLRRELFGAV